MTPERSIGHGRSRCRFIESRAGIDPRPEQDTDRAGCFSKAYSITPRLPLLNPIEARIPVVISLVSKRVAPFLPLRTRTRLEPMTCVEPQYALATRPENTARVFPTAGEHAPWRPSMSRIPLIAFLRRLGRVSFALAFSGTIALADDFAPKSDERQLPHAMHSEMSERPTITVGRAGTDLVGADNRALQAAVDYVAGLGGGVVEIGEGEYLMRDSLHLRSDVTVRGRKGKTILRKADAASRRWPSTATLANSRSPSRTPRASTVGAGVADLGRQRRGLPHDRGPDHGPPRQHLLDRRAPDGRLHGRRPREGGHRFPRRQRHGHQGGASRGPRHRGEQGGATPTSTAAAVRGSTSIAASARRSRAASCGITMATGSASSNRTT